MNERRLELLQTMPIFGGVRLDVLELLMPYVDQVERGPGEFFFQENDPGTNVFVLETGRVAIRKRLEKRELLLWHAGPGDCFGEVALLDFGPRTATVQAVETTRALEIEASDLIKVLRRDPEQFALIYMNLARELARRLRAADAQLLRAHVEKNVGGLGFELRLL
jgi:CRP-like cAMP-binding protein